MRSDVTSNRRRGVQGERMLCSAILVRAISDLFISEYCPEKSSAKAWVYSDDLEPPSYLWVCDALDLEPQAVREGLIGMKRPNYINVFRAPDGYFLDVLE